MGGGHVYKCPRRQEESDPLEDWSHESSSYERVESNPGPLEEWCLLLTF